MLVIILKLEIPVDKMYHSPSGKVTVRRDCAGADMDRREFVLAALAPAKGEQHTPVQVQKLLFILDDKLPDNTYTPRFVFQPYDYGPFDVNVYYALESLSENGLVDICPGYWRSYRLTVKGQGLGDKHLGSLSEKHQQFVRNVSAFVRKLTFTELLSAVYKAYPKMAVNSVFQENRS